MRRKSGRIQGNGLFVRFGIQPNQCLVPFPDRPPWFGKNRAMLPAREDLGLLFLDLRDRSGIAQAVVEMKTSIDRIKEQVQNVE